MVVLTIVALFLTIAVPAFRGLIQYHKVTTATNDLFAAVTLTRSEAIGRGIRVDLVPAGDGSDWSKGWIVFVDQNDDQKVNPGERVIFSHGPVGNDVDIKAAFTDSKVQYLAYTESGRTRTNSSSQSPQLGSWSIVIGGKVRRIKINFLGRPRICNPETEKSTC